MSTFRWEEGRKKWFGDAAVLSGPTDCLNKSGMEDGDVGFPVILAGFLSGGQGEDGQSKCQSFRVNKARRLYLWRLYGLIKLICQIEVAGDVISAEVREVIKSRGGFQLLLEQGLRHVLPAHLSQHIELDKQETWWKSDKGRKKGQAFVVKHLSSMSMVCVFVFDLACISREMSRVFILILSSSITVTTNWFIYLFVHWMMTCEASNQS